MGYETLHCGRCNEQSAIDEDSDECPKCGAIFCINCHRPVEYHDDETGEYYFHDDESLAGVDCDRSFWIAATQGPEALAVMRGDDRLGTVATAIGHSAWRHTLAGGGWSSEYWSTPDEAAVALTESLRASR